MAGKPGQTASSLVEKHCPVHSSSTYPSGYWIFTFEIAKSQNNHLQHKLRSNQKENQFRLLYPDFHIKHQIFLHDWELK
ncbi:hypothetical protein SAMN06264849_105203 [Melghirimyces algeriensis]|uniref:Uncharacterized protein n=1 Tax=Melghirimyces algeriensis TaxID=910412 RepID=A0A521D9U0_9BACL|nr:hypothetical protein SAMN06264849_105203 [Melghirimyces algeriensis]